VVVSTSRRDVRAFVAIAVAVALTTVVAAPWFGTAASAQVVPDEVQDACDDLGLADPLCALVQQADAVLGGQTGLGAPPEAIAAFQESWIARALALQRTLGDRLRFDDSEWVSTHNSFNDPNTTPIGVAELDPNQVYGLPDQLRMGVREIELDIHPAPHGTDDSAPCHAVCTFERPLAERLAEIRAWMDADGNADEILVIDVGDTDLSGDAWDLAAAEFLAAFGDRLYRPPSDGDCHVLPVEVTRNQLRAAGHRVVVVGGCGEGTAWPSITWHWFPVRSQVGFPGVDPYPDCSVLGRAEPSDGTVRRHWEDSTFVGSVATGYDELDPEAVRELMRCGVNLVSVDQLEPFDGRLEASVWSWADDEPAAGDCAAMGPDGRFVAEDCADLLPAACRDLATGAWSVTTAWTDADGADAACATEGRGEASVPASSIDAEQLRAVMAAGNCTSTWLDYRVVDGTWTPEAAGMQAPAPAPAPDSDAAAAAAPATACTAAAPVPGADADDPDLPATGAGGAAVAVLALLTAGGVGTGRSRARTRS
jgi:hypothetical protein